MAAKNLTLLAFFMFCSGFGVGGYTGRYMVPYLSQADRERIGQCTVDGEHVITRVVDGDTVAIQLCGVEEKLRLIGINAPELHNTKTGPQCFGQEAADEATKLLFDQKVIIETDPTQGNKHTHRDMHGRLLVYIFIEDDVTIFQRLFLKFERRFHVEKSNNCGERMIADGYAHEEQYDRAYSYGPEFKAAEARAKSARKGMWADPACAEVSEKTTVRMR
jgi:micrococcal nuclease